ncbi:MAG: M48 family metallopeptidase [Xanthomonadales bacterium]|nr:M48 family metallopeptidase [Xanthomonadales bacterium]
MNFFEHQDRARRQSRWLVLMFGLALLAIVAAIDAILLLVLGTSTTEYAERFGGQPLHAAGLVQANVSLLTGGAIATLGVVGVASLFRTISLKMGGGQVARQLGGTLVESDTRDLRRRRLRNVVEEIALASGVPVPEIYVLEQESGINAFAAGYSPADAAVAVTRGALEKLSRDELQGVIAHEFSHVLNGDMRLNIRLMGTLFGILLLALIGRRVLMHARFGRSDRNAAAVMLIAAGLMLVGYIGLFFGRWIKAGVSRQREYLADASAVQFTRDPNGIGGALKKIAVYSDGSLLRADTEEVSHMLFGDGQRMLLFATHPPLHERIRRIDPGFREEDLDRLRAAIVRDQAREREAARADAAEERPVRAAGGAFDIRGMIEQIGQPGWERMLAAAALAAALPDNLRRAAHSTEWAPEVLFYALLDADEDVRERQLNLLAGRMGADSEAQVRALLKAAGLPRAEQRLPLLDLAFSALKRRPPEFVTQVLDTVKALIDVDGRVDVFEFLLARVISQHLWEAQSPDTVRTAGRRKLADCREPALRVLAVLARHGHDDHSASAAAFTAGCAALGQEAPDGLPDPGDWVKTLDADLPVLDRLGPAAKERFVGAMAAVVTHDGRMVPAELELLRAACALIHVPLPLFAST